MLFVSNFRKMGGEGSTRVSCESMVVAASQRPWRRQLLAGNQTGEVPSPNITLYCPLHRVGNWDPDSFTLIGRYILSSQWSRENHPMTCA
jgi:hypothetical protein